eukprot:m.61547 g.61547  ORF g.61547 m.61547 type:complete len:931 (-) comp7091_c0_seq2:406-3198(-)
MSRGTRRLTRPLSTATRAARPTYGSITAQTSGSNHSRTRARLSPVAPGSVSAKVRAAKEKRRLVLKALTRKGAGSTTVAGMPRSMHSSNARSPRPPATSSTLVSRAPNVSTSHATNSPTRAFFARRAQLCRRVRSARDDGCSELGAGHSHGGAAQGCSLDGLCRLESETSRRVTEATTLSVRLPDTDVDDNVDDDVGVDTDAAETEVGADADTEGDGSAGAGTGTGVGDASADADVGADADADADGAVADAPASEPAPKVEPIEGAKAIIKPESYFPTPNKYHPIKDACWAEGKPVPYRALCGTFAAVEATSKRLEMIAILRNFFRSVIVLTPQDLVTCVYLSANSLAPAYKGVELGIGESILFKALSEATGRTLQQVKTDMEAAGDIGEVAANSRNKQSTLQFMKPVSLTVAKVFSRFTELANMSGNKSQQRKVDLIKQMLVACDEVEAKYLIRALGGKLRLGLAEQSLLVSLAHAAAYTQPAAGDKALVLDASRGVHEDTFKTTLEQAALTLKDAFCRLPNFDHVVGALQKYGLSDLSSHCRVTPGVPIKPMLAHPTTGVHEIMKRFEGNKFVCEYKYDGERAQVHRTRDGSVHIYSRNSEDHTSKYPDIIARISNCLIDPDLEFILDCEAVAVDKATGQIRPFQVLSTRKRKDADASEITVQVCLFAFDLIYAAGKCYVEEPLDARKTALRSLFREVPGEMLFASSIVTSDVDQIQEFLDQSIRDSCEGLMVKSLDVDATYEIAKRSHSWLKLKKDYLDGVGDTVDLVVIGAWKGKGKRLGVYGAFLLACYDPDGEAYQSICKIGTGFSDEDLKTHTESLSKIVIPTARHYYKYDSTLEPDVWFDAAQVWEVRAADLSISPVHKAATGLVDSEKGISLRFPRFLRIREDKNADDATTASQVASMYESQESVKKNQPKAGGDDDEEDA